MEKDRDTNLLPVGTSFSGYAEPRLGPFRCGNCEHFDSGPPSHCEHIAVKSDTEVKHDREGHALVDPSGCCTYFRKG